jgi:hypothetical protein
MTTLRWLLVAGLVGFGLTGLLAGHPTECGLCFLLALIVKP